MTVAGACPCAVQPKAISTTSIAIEAATIVPIRRRSAPRAPITLPSTIPSPNSASSHGIAPAANPATSVISGAT